MNLIRRLKYLMILTGFWFFVISGCGKNPTGVGSIPFGAAGSTGQYKTAEGTSQISTNPDNTQKLYTDSFSNIQSILTKSNISVGGPTSTIKLDSKAFPFCAAPLAPPTGYSGPTTGPDGTNGWYKYTWDISTSGVTSSGDSYLKTSPGDYYADSNALIKAMDWWMRAQGSFNVSGHTGSYSISTKYRVIGISSTKIGGYFRYDGSSTSNGGSYKWDWQWDFEQSTLESDKSGKYTWYATYSAPEGSYTYNGNAEFNSDGSGDGKVYQNNSLILTIHWGAGGKTGYYITSDGVKHDFSG